MTSIQINTENVNRDGLQQQVARLLRRQVAVTEKSGSRLPNERDLSDRYGVSIRTIREAVGTLVHDGLLERRHGSGTYVADLRKIRYVGILVGQGLAVPSPYSPTLHVAQRLMDWLHQHGLRGEIYAGHGNERSPYQSVPFEAVELVNDLDRGLVSALVAISANPHPSWFDLAKSLNVPIMGLNSSFDHSASFDIKQSLKLLFQHNASIGHTDLAVAAWCDQDAPSNQLSPAGVTALAKECGCTVRPGCQITDEHPGKPGAGWRVMERFLSLSQQPQAVVLADDHFYRDAAMALLAKGVKVPEQLHVSTIINKDMHNFLPFPTDVVELDANAVAVQLGHMLKNRIEGNELMQLHHAVAGELRINQCSL